MVEGHQPQQEGHHARPAQADGKALLGRLVAEHDVLVENFRTGTLDEWGITRDWLQGINPRLTILRVTGFGQTGPYRRKPGFARVFEAMSGFTRMCGEEGGTPLHLGYPISDAVGGLFGAIGVLAELVRLKNDPAARGQEIDCAVTEAMMRTLDFLAIEYDQLGTVRTQSGNRSQYAAPGNIYATSDGKWASIAASTQSIFERFCAALGLQSLLADPRFVDNPSRVKNWQAIDGIVSEAISRLTLEELGARLHGASGRLLADLRRRRYFRRSAFHRARGHRHRRRTRNSARCACNAWCRGFPKRRFRCAAPARRSASTMTRSMARSDCFAAGDRAAARRGSDLRAAFRHKAETPRATRILRQRSEEGAPCGVC